MRAKLVEVLLSLPMRLENLQKKTLASTKQIESTVSHIQKNISNVSSYTVNVTNVVSEQQNSIDLCFQSFQEIQGAIVELNQAIHEILVATEEQSSVSKQITENVTEMGNESFSVLQKVDDLSISFANMTAVLMDIEKMYISMNYSAKNSAFLKAKAAHIIFMRNVINNYNNDTFVQLADHTTCAFGQFYYGEGMKHFADSKIFRDIEEPHLLVHKLGKELMETVRNNEKIVNDGRMAELEETVHELVAILDKLVIQYDEN